MKRWMIVAALVVMVAVFGAVSQASAQDNPPNTPYGQGGGRWGRGPMMGDPAQMGPMHEYMQAAIAEALGLPVDELAERHANGETFWQIAEAQGYTFEEARQLMLDARSAALAEMVEDGLITQDQADWMKDRGGRMHGGRGSGMGRGRGGCQGGGRWGQDL